MSERLDPREFERHLAERLLTAQQQAGGQSLLEIESGDDSLPGGRHWLVDPAQAGEIVPLPPLLPVPLTRPWFAGIANIRGLLYSVVDFAAWRGGAPTPRNAQARLLLIGARDGSHCALLVERALGLRATDTLQIAPAAEQTIADVSRSGMSAAWSGTTLVAADGNARWTRLDVPLLLVTPAFLDIALAA